jgi:DNA-binding NarL/FixJ family response regulator
MTNEPMHQSSRTCARCGGGFHAMRRQNICPRCRKPNSQPLPGNLIGACARNQQLSPREIHVVRLVCLAKSNKEIAAELKLTLGTIKIYLHQIYGKLNVSNRMQLALLYAYRAPTDDMLSSAWPIMSSIRGSL